MKDNVRSGWRRLKGQSGNTVILMNVMCLMLLVLTLASLDVFSILASRRYAQTDADAAATAGVRAIQPIVMGALQSVAQAKIDRLVNAGIADWQEDGAKGSPEPYIASRLADEIHNGFVVAYIMGQATSPPATEDFIQSLLTPREQACAVNGVADIAHSDGEARARQFLRDSDISTIDLEFPSEGRPWVAVQVRRKVPSVFVRKVLGHIPEVEITAGATLKGISGITLGNCS